MRVSCVFYLLLLLVFSCETDVENYNLSNKLTIQGIWFHDSGVPRDSNLSYRNEIIFKKDGAYERSVQIVENNDFHNIVGYLSIITGEYQVIGNKLKRFNIKQYGLDNVNPYLGRQDLIFESATNELPEIGLMLNNQEDELTLDYFVNGRTCPDYASCIEHEIFYRE